MPAPFTPSDRAVAPGHRNWGRLAACRRPRKPTRSVRPCQMARSGHAEWPGPELAERNAVRLGTVLDTSRREVSGVCRNIRTLYNFEPLATEDEIRAAALQFVRKISGFATPSAANKAAFNRAVDEVARASSTLLVSLVTTASPRDRAVEAARAHARAELRYGPHRSRQSG
jgi:hypothetical protein